MKGRGVIYDRTRQRPFPGLLKEQQSKSKVCANVFCGAGRECTVTEKGEPSCLCIESHDNGDSQLDSSELLKFIQQNDSVVELQSYADQESNKLLRSLCVDALIELSDENADWKLSFDEFLNCLKPGFNPPEKKCALEDETYEDGAETQVECNRCVCACGNWVCTAMTCADKTEAVDETADTGADMTEDEWNLRVAELNKHQETVEKMKGSTKEA
ncbi:Follistatin-related protein 1 [Liparis tanakae]|uniref:Follistatin-related protein 1 n=1 Tax=Liparis tanakae TaxID=230148 RepID=A0A4Z2H1X8_9TELE|nr:Follistatin-related protein 1 [Liparis tanakae]